MSTKCDLLLFLLTQVQISLAVKSWLVITIAKTEVQISLAVKSSGVHCCYLLITTIACICLLAHSWLVNV